MTFAPPASPEWMAIQPHVTAHHLDDEDAHVRLGGRVQAVDRLRRDADRRVEAEGVVGGGQVVVDGLRNTDDMDAVLVVQARGHAQGVLAADRDERLDLLLGEVLLDAPDAVLLLERIRPRGAEDGAATGQDAAYGGDVEPDGVVLERPAPAVAEADEVVVVLLHALADDAPDDGVESGAVAASGQYSDPHGKVPSPRLPEGTHANSDPGHFVMGRKGNSVEMCGC